MMNNQLQAKIAQVVDESLALLTINLTKEINQSPQEKKFDIPLPRLLKQCLMMCEQHQVQAQEPIRCIIHFGLPLDSPLFSSLEMMANTRILRLEGENFLDDLRLNYQKSRQLGQRLLIFCDYFSLKQAVSTDLLNSLESQFKVKSMVIVTDPVDSYAVYCDAMHANESLLNFESYCQRILDFLEVISKLVVIRHEDFLGDPERITQEICNQLILPFNKNFPLLKEVNNVSV